MRIFEEDGSLEICPLFLSLLVLFLYFPLTTAAEKGKNTLKLVLRKTCTFLQVEYSKEVVHETSPTHLLMNIEGPNGAYNLYEAELRMNMIISRLDTIITNLEYIWEHQFTLYNELKQSNYTLNRIASDVSGTLSSTNEIKSAQDIITYCSDATAINTQVLNYIDFANR